MKKKYYLYVRKGKIEIEKEIYTEFNKLVCRQKYSERKYMQHAIPLETITDQVNLEDEAINKMMIEKLNQALKQLTDEEYNLISELFFNEKSERSISREWDIHPMTIHSRKKKILAKLKNIIKK